MGDTEKADYNVCVKCVTNVTGSDCKNSVANVKQSDGIKYRKNI